MSDRLSQAQRSAHMRRIRAKGSAPERAVRRCAHSLGFRFRLHRRDLPGTPDLVFPRFRSVIFVHGCFWHQHKGCRLARMPKSRPEYWSPKLARNRERDIETAERLTSLGWHVAVVWECETYKSDFLAERIMSALYRQQFVD